MTLLTQRQYVPNALWTDDEVEAFGRGGVIVWDGALSTPEIQHLKRCLFSPEHLRPATIGKDKRHLPDVRGDHMWWPTEDHLPDFLRTWLGGFREATRRELWITLGEMELQASQYPGDGARYAKHRDTFRGHDQRLLTVLFYLNEGWQKQHGGALKVYPSDASPLTIHPIGGRVVVFPSSVPHEVLPCHRHRSALTAWFRRPQGSSLR